ncbi:MAG TPA: NUDIX domain-containing protein [Gemmatimonadaceae bacterium]|jgi:8-oxo-dGTP diphosphatase|nr:NUDIX domain-containing protein [Gemmatimonadaceae bacterium]
MEPIVNERGERLLSVLSVAESELYSVAPVTFSLVIARSEQGILLIFNRKRKVWELPGGMIDPHESARVCAERELAEETCHSVSSLRWLGLIELDTGVEHADTRSRVEYGALFCGDVIAQSAVVKNEEVEEMGFFSGDSLPLNVSPIDRYLLSLCR